MYRLAITRDFIARHFLIGGDWGAENHEHSHHYKVQVLLRGDSLDRHGYLADIVELEAALEEAIGRYRDRTLNELPPFEGLNPSLERFARVLWEDLRARPVLDGLALEVKLWENESDWAAYGETGPDRVR
jgi:6-pyruvoyltetrahydropterin/6-carboxytetrahydropterin synthase